VALEKTCTKCKVSKPVSEFGKHRNLPDGLAKWCKLCQRESRRKYYWANKEEDDRKSRTRNKKRYEEDPEFQQCWRCVTCNRSGLQTTPPRETGLLAEMCYV